MGKFYFAFVWDVLEKFMCVFVKIKCASGQTQEQISPYVNLLGVYLRYLLGVYMRYLLTP